MPVLMFQPRFVPKVLDRTKRQTIRPVRLRPIYPGDKLSLRRWYDKPYRSKHVVLQDEVCCAYKPITIEPDTVRVGGEELSPELREELAVCDGFASWSDMREWFVATHGLPFEGVLIMWE